MRYRYLTADVFTDRPFGGNPLAVFPDARGISGERMQQVARELNLSETVFVLPPDDSRHTRQAADLHAGHRAPVRRPSDGGHGLRAGGDRGDSARRATRPRIVFEEGVGPVPVLIRAEDGKPVFSQLTAAKLPEVGPPPPPIPELAEMLSLDPADLLDGETLRGGLLRRPLPLRSAARPRRRRAAPALRMDRWEQLVAGFWATEVYVFARDPELPGSAPPLAHVRAAHGDRRRPGDRRRHRLLRRLSRLPLPGARRHPALGDRAGFRDGPPEPPPSGSRQAGRPRSPRCASAAPRC